MGDESPERPRLPIQQDDFGDVDNDVESNRAQDYIGDFINIQQNEDELMPLQPVNDIHMEQQSSSASPPVFRNENGDHAQGANNSILQEGAEQNQNNELNELAVALNEEPDDSGHEMDHDGDDNDSNGNRSSSDEGEEEEDVEREIDNFRQQNREDYVRWGQLFFGHHLRPDSDSERETDDDENVEHFDISLPGRHLYLQEGDARQDGNQQPLPPVPAQPADTDTPSVHDQDLAPTPVLQDVSESNTPPATHLPPLPIKTIRLPVLDYSRTHNSLLVMPGMKLPLIVASTRDRNAIFSAMRTPQFSFVCLDLRQSGRTFGCVMRILSVEQDVDSLQVLTQAKKRYKLHDVYTEHTGVVIAVIECLPDLLITNPLVLARLAAVDRHLHPTQRQQLMMDHTPIAASHPGGSSALSVTYKCCTKIFKSLKRKSSLDPEEKLQHLERHNRSLKRKRDFVQRTNSYLTANPDWVYQQGNVYRLAEQVRRFLVSANNVAAVQIPHSPWDVCHYACCNLPLDDKARRHLLQMPYCHQRLHYLSGLVSKWNLLLCKQCSSPISNRSDIIVISEEGAQSAFVNPGGFVHEMITVKAAQELRLIGGSSTEHSWFPGYAWTIANCGSCHQHVGWKFTALKNSLRPRKFYGLTRGGVKPNFSVSDDQENARD